MEIKLIPLSAGDLRTMTDMVEDRSFTQLNRFFADLEEREDAEVLSESEHEEMKSFISEMENEDLTLEYAELLGLFLEEREPEYALILSLHDLSEAPLTFPWPMEEKAVLVTMRNEE